MHRNITSFKSPRYFIPPSRIASTSLTPVGGGAPLLGTSPSDSFRFEPINESGKKFDPEVESDPVVWEITKRIERDGAKEHKINEKDGSVIRPKGTY